MASGAAGGILHLWFSRVLVGLDEDLADADVLANGPQSGLHGLPSTEDGHAGDLRGVRAARSDEKESF